MYFGNGLDVFGRKRDGTFWYDKDGDDGLDVLGLDKYGRDKNGIIQYLYDGLDKYGCMDTG